jgi:hypothetical protein
VPGVGRFALDDEVLRAVAFGELEDVDAERFPPWNQRRDAADVAEIGGPYRPVVGGWCWAARIDVRDASRARHAMLKRFIKSPFEDVRSSRHPTIRTIDANCRAQTTG